MANHIVEVSKVKLVRLPIGTRYYNVEDKYYAEIIKYPGGYDNKGVIVLGAFQDYEFMLKGDEEKLIDIRRVGHEVSTTDI